MRVYRILMIESAARGVLCVNGQFCGPLEEGGQAFPASPEAEIYAQLFPFSPGAAPLTVEMRLRGGEIERLEPQEHAYALLWPDGIIELELRPGWPGEPPAPQETRTIGSSAVTCARTLPDGVNKYASCLPHAAPRPSDASSASAPGAANSARVFPRRV